MLRDLSNKYQAAVPDRVSLTQVQRLVALYAIPEPYRQLLPAYNVILSGGDESPAVILSGKTRQRPAYDHRLDVTSETFDALLAFGIDGESRLVSGGGRIIACNLHMDKRDNMSKLRHLIPGSDGFVFKPPDRTKIEDTRAQEPRVEK